ncbi:uncharacterized protein LOC110107682 [Dendrobium catenatum]|uniref:uncharacterized protein LOC110107682 n=1 Tax=Dendrobium catenatum TaxID=906689 RepID=UPI0009F50CDD|nr:uncharacterized protein LOC110107682 [Dendrobium catenatum]
MKEESLFPNSVDVFSPEKGDALGILEEKIDSVKKPQNSVEQQKMLHSDLMKVRNVESAEKGDYGDDVANPVRDNGEEQTNAWRRKENIKVSELQLGNFLAEDGVTVKYNEQNKKDNANKLSNSIVIKVFGGEPPVWVISSELRRQGSQFGKFHLTMLGMGWVLCSFPESDQMEAVMANGLWFLNGYIIGMDEWPQTFSPTSLKGLTALIWIRLSNLPLHCWDNINICRIASMIGKPYLLDGNMFQWGRREFRKVCVQIKLDAKLPLGVWVEVKEVRIQDGNGRSNEDSEYGPLIVVNRGRKRVNNKAQKFTQNPLNKVLWKRKESRNAKDSSENTEAVNVKETVTVASQILDYSVLIPKANGEILARENCNASSTKNGPNTRENISIPIAENKFSALCDQVEDGEIVQEKADELPSLVGPPKVKTSKNSISNTIPLEYGKEDGSNMAKKKKSKQLKDLGPISTNPRGRRMEIEMNETKLSTFDMKEVKMLIREGWDYVMVPSNGLSGGIIALCNTNLTEFSLLEFSSQCIIGDLSVCNKNKWRVALVYGNKDLYKRRDLWNILDLHSSNELPMVIGGDLNCLTSREDKKGPKEMEAFFANNDYHDVRFIGPRFTWCNNNDGGARNLERFDSCFLNSMALNSSNHLVVRHRARIASYHCPVIINFLELKSSNSMFIKFEDVWTSYSAALAVVKNEWNKSFLGSQSQIFNSKFKRVLKALFFWSKTKLKNLILLKDNLMEEILNLQTKESNTGWLTEEKCWILKAKGFELNSNMARLNTWWKQRAKVKWMEDGDNNSKFFHAFSSARRSLNKIVKIKDNDGVVLKEPNQIEGVLIQFFRNKWRQRICNMEGWPLPRSVLNEDDKSWLAREFSLIEIEVVLKQLGGNLHQVVLVAAKLILNGLISVIPKLVSEEQVSFIKGRSISDQLLAQEVFHKFKYSKSSKGLVSYKIDMEQAYDSMSWVTLEGVLKYFEFPPMFSKLILECVVEPRFSLIINGNLSDWIEAKSVFQQGCPLSHLLLILCPQLLTNALALSSIGISLCPNGRWIFHLLYTDDVMIFSEANKKVAMEIKCILDKFSVWT